MNSGLLGIYFSDLKVNEVVGHEGTHYANLHASLAYAAGQKHHVCARKLQAWGDTRDVSHFNGLLIRTLPLDRLQRLIRVQKAL